MTRACRQLSQMTVASMFGWIGRKKTQNQDFQKAEKLAQNSECPPKPIRMIGHDYVKAFAITLVVIGHTLRGLFSANIIPEESIWAVIDKGIYLFHMPLFFFLSGVFIQRSFLRRGVSGLIKHNFINLIIPLIIWSYIQTSLQYASTGNVNTPVNLQDVLMAPFPPKQQFWFLWTLFLISCFSGIILQVKNGKYILGVLAILTVSTLCITNLSRYDSVDSKIIEILELRQAIIYFPYFIMGMVFTPYYASRIGLGIFGSALLFIAAISLYLTQENNSNIMYYAMSSICIYTAYNIGMCISDRTGQDRTGQDRTGQDRTGQDRTEKYSYILNPIFFQNYIILSSLSA